MLKFQINQANYKKLLPLIDIWEKRKIRIVEIAPIKDLPCEVMIEVEPRCNFNCQFCFNKVSFAKKGRDIKSLSTDYIKKIINSIARARIKIIRFTGGEPFFVGLVTVQPKINAEI